MVKVKVHSIEHEELLTIGGVFPMVISIVTATVKADGVKLEKVEFKFFDEINSFEVAKFRIEELFE